MDKTSASGGASDDARLQSDATDGPAETFGVEHEGQIYQLPAALEGGFLRQADYTRKTQEVAQHRRALIDERAAVARHAQALDNVSAGQVRLAALDHLLDEMNRVDWRTLAAQDPQGAQALWARFQGFGQARAGLAQALAQHATGRRQHAQRQGAARMAATGQVLSRDIDGWSPELAAKLVDYARGHGVTLDELGAADDPRIWKILHCAYQGDSARQKDGTATATARAQAVRPAVMVSGGAAGGGGVRDELATKDWMKRRNDQLRKGR